MKETKDNIRMYSWAPIVTLVALGVMFVFLVVFGEITAKKGAQLKNDLSRTEKTIDSIGDLLIDIEQESLSSDLINQEDVSNAMNEIIDQGKGLGLKFVSIELKDIEQKNKVSGKKAKKDINQIQPIILKIESEYENFGLFLSALEKLKGSVVAVESFQIMRLDESTTALNFTVTLNMYLKNSAYAKK